MRLENLYEDFSTLNSTAQIAYIASYRKRRAEDMLKPPKKKKKSSTAAKKTLKTITDEEKEVMKLLGLTRKQMVELRESITADEDIVDDNGDMTSLFQDDSFDNEEGGID